MRTEKTVLVTGATKGIGREVALQLAAAGWRVYAVGRDAKALAALKASGTVEGEVCDLGDGGAAVAMYGRAREVLGRVDVLVNNAGFNRAKEPLTGVTQEGLDESYAVNVRAPILLAREALKEMGGRRSGHIVNVISSVVRCRPENYAVYATMKHAVHGFTGCLLREAQPLKVKVTAVYPGGVDTGFRAQRRADYLTAASAARMIVGCIEAPEDVVVHEILYRPMVETNF
jgi:NAD(P)-dependent dehydrogenase (short-subunit alcohol dehydrogenase family)